ncbi:HD domain-containing protein [Tundrisphaera sp. TA3]|uniref:HD domain-containing protein n=1 Tax=Tundrisphaera sp. TA3 TaxID=3435775 RepID=UPI003EB980F2
MPDRPLGPSPRFEAALRLAAAAHLGQSRRGADVPYIEHPYAVALILDRAGFDEDVAIAGLLHDAVEDTATTLDAIRDRFGDRVASIVAACSEEKLDASGVKRPWADRKRDHLAAAASAPAEARAVILADKLHNLLCILVDLRDGRPVWDGFNADRASVLAYQRAMIDACHADTPRLAALATECRTLYEQVAAFVA